jgi:UDP-N-acetylmuramoylalanine--D-glutamate ligase
VREATAPIDLQHATLDSFEGRPVAVLGLARSGVALARFFAARGAKVTVYDGRGAEQLEREIEQIGATDARLLLGAEIDPRSALDGQALIATSPSVNSRYPTTEPRLRAALADVEAAGAVPVVSEVDLFLRLCPATTVGVTGTKGKTTTSSLTAAVLGAGPAPVVLGGNIGIPLIERLPELTPAHRVVVELSELQLPTLSRGTDVALYTHVTSDHLDRHGTVEAYRGVKRRLAELLARDGRLVLNGEDPVSSAYEHATPAPTVFYRRGEPLPGGVGVRDRWIVANDVALLEGGSAAMTGPDGRIMPLDELPLPGDHNVSNVLGAIAVALLFGVAPDAIRRAVGDFQGVEHRLEPVANVDRVLFVNDSQGTQPDAVIAALRSFAPPIVLICGGRSKNVSIDALASEVAQRAAAVVVIGETADEYAAAFRTAGAQRIAHARDLESAVRDADATARELGGGTVLLSPAAASFDMFVDYAARGTAFKEIVARIAAEHSPQPSAESGK